MESDDGARRLPARRLPAQRRRRPRRSRRRWTGSGRGVTAALLIDVPDDEVVERISGPARLPEERPRLQRPLRPAQARRRVRPGRLAARPARRRRRGRRPQAPGGLPRRRPRRSSRFYEDRGCSSASTARARPPRSTTTSGRRSPRCASKTSCDHQEVTRGDRQDGRRGRRSSSARCSCSRARSARASPPPDLDEAAEKFIRSQGAEPAFKGYRGFPGSICASPNSMVVHGIPGAYRLQRGDIICSTSASSRTAGSPMPRARSRSARSRRSPRSCSTSRSSRCSTRSSSAAPATASATSRTRSRQRVEAAGPERRALARRPRHRALDARGAADPQLRRARARPAARGGDGPRRRADGQRRPPHGPHGRRRLGDLLPGRLAGRPLRVHGRDHRRRARGSSRRGTSNGDRRAGRTRGAAGDPSAICYRPARACRYACAQSATR